MDNFLRNTEKNILDNDEKTSELFTNCIYMLSSILPSTLENIIDFYLHEVDFYNQTVQ